CVHPGWGRPQISGESGGPAAGQLGHIWISFLRHQAGASAKCVAEFQKSEFACAPQNQVLAQAREMKAHHRETKKKFTDKVAIADRIETILTSTRKPEFARDQFAIENDSRPGKRTGAQRANIRPPPASTQ